MTQSHARKLLIIAYEFPPSAGGGVQRIMKLARYLPESGWQPYVLSATHVWGRPVDEGLVAQVADVEVRRLPNRNVAAWLARALAPFKRLRSSEAGARITGDRRMSKSLESVSAPVAVGAAGAPLSTRIARRFYLDAADPWSRSVPAAAERWDRDVGFDAVLASGPPHSVLVAGVHAARTLALPFVADLRDPWRGNPGYRWPDAPSRDWRSLELEHVVMRAADRVLAVSQPIADEALAEGCGAAVVVPNGFDRSDLPDWSPVAGPLSIAFMGRFYGTTDPAPFLEGAALAIARGGAAADLRIDVVGQVSSTIQAAVTARGLDAVVRYLGFLSHADAVAVVARADAGLVVLKDVPGAEAIYTSKLFEYLGIGVPVLLVGPARGVAAELLHEAQAGIVVRYGDVAGVADALERIASEKAAGTRVHAPRADVVARFERRAQAATVAAILDEIAGGPHA